MGSAGLVAAVGGVGALGACVLGVVALSAGAGSSAGAERAVSVSVLGQLQQDECVATGAVPTLDGAQASNAETVVAAAEALGAGEQGAQIALMTAYTESGLNNVGAEEGNDGSLGLFQQRVVAGWGTAAEEEDPTDAAGMFVEALLGLADWQAIKPWVAAQDVQRSAFDGDPSAANGGSAIVGGNYEANWNLAATLLDAITGLSEDQVCGGENGAEPAGPASRYGLPPGYAIPSDATPAETLAITYALTKLGDPYVWGAAGPGAFDCSGLTMMAWAQAGVTLDHTTAEQMYEGTPVASYGAISPGDLVLIPGSDGTLSDPGHVGIYLGEGLVESAVDPAQGVIVQTWAEFVAGGLSGIRNLG